MSSELFPDSIESANDLPPCIRRASRSQQRTGTIEFLVPQQILRGSCCVWRWTIPIFPKRTPPSVTTPRDWQSLGCEINARVLQVCPSQSPPSTHPYAWTLQRTEWVLGTLRKFYRGLWPREYNKFPTSAESFGPRATTQDANRGV